MYTVNSSQEVFPSFQIVSAVARIGASAGRPETARRTLYTIRLFPAMLTSLRSINVKGRVGSGGFVQPEMQTVSRVKAQIRRIIAAIRPREVFILPSCTLTLYPCVESNCLALD